MRLSKFGWILLLPIGIGAAFSYPAWSATFETGLDAVYAGDKDKAFSVWKILAARGDARAQFRLARLYDLNSAADEKNLQRAVEWYKKAAEQGLPSAQNRLGELTAEGRGVPKDSAGAFQLWQSSAKQNDAQAQYNLGLAYFRGEGTAENPELAEKWLRSAANEGYAPAEFVLGQLRNEGLLLAQDQGRALAWFLRASDNGHPEATAQVRALLATGVSPTSLPAVQPVQDTEETSSAKAELAGAEAKMSALVEDLQAAEQERNNLRQALDNARDELGAQDAAALAAAAELEGQLAAVQQEVKARDVETAAAREQTAEKSKELAAAQREITDLRAAMTSLEEGFVTEIAVLKMQVAAGSVEAARQSESFTAAQSEIASLRYEVTTARAEVERTQAALAKAETEATEITNTLSARQLEASANADALAAAKNEIEALKTEATAATAEAKRQSVAMTALEQQVSELTANASADKAKLTEGDEALASAETEIASLKAKIAAGAVELANRDEAIAVGERKISELQASATAETVNLEGKNATLAQAQAEAAKLRERLRSNEAEMTKQAEALATSQSRFTDLEEELTNVEDKLIAAEERGQTDLKKLNDELIETRQEVVQLIALKAGLEDSLKTAEVSAKSMIGQLESDAADALEQVARVGAAAKLWEQDSVAKTDALAKLRAEMLEVDDQLAATEGLLSAKDRLLASLKSELNDELSLARERIQELEATQTASVQEAAVQSDRADRAEQRIVELSAALTSAEKALQADDQAESAATAKRAASPEILVVTPVAAARKIEPARATTVAPAKVSDANIKRGDEYLALGDIASARLFYELSMDGGNTRAATSIGKTFDPLYLQSLDVVGAPGRPEKAREWYEIGAGAGDDDALARLKALKAWEER